MDFQILKACMEEKPQTVNILKTELAVFLTE